MATIHTPYDAMGAFRSAGVGLSWIESCFREQDLHMIFCSEWVAAAYADIGIFCRLSMRPAGIRTICAGRFGERNWYSNHGGCDETNRLECCCW